MSGSKRVLGQWVMNVRNGAHSGARRKGLAPDCLRVGAVAAGRCLEQDGSRPL